MPVPSARPYTLLARFYDQLQPQAPRMNRHARRKILGEIGSRVRSVCDLGCGTGTTAIEFARRGCQVFAVDLSPELCRITREKARRARLPVRVLRADMRSFRLPRPVELVTSEFSVINHLPRRAELRRVFRSVWRALRPAGYFLFDIDTCLSFKEQYSATYWFEHPEFALVLRGRYNSRRRKAWLNFEWFLPAGSLRRWQREQMENVCWSDGEIQSALRSSGFRCLGSWDGREVRPASMRPRPGYDRYYLAQKPSFDHRRQLGK